MEHVIVLLNLLTLMAGLAVAAGLFRAWVRRRDALGFWQFLHFSGFTFTMVVVALDAYSVVNIVANDAMIRLWSALVLVGTSVMLFCFPMLARTKRGQPRTRGFVAFWGVLALIPLGGAGFLVFLQDYTLALVVIFLAFLPFWASVVYGLAGQSSTPRDRRLGWGALAVLGSLGAAEVTGILLSPPVQGYFFVTLPVAYLYTAWVTWRRPVPPPTTGLPPGLAVEAGLTPRETEIANGILRGLANKELAHEFGLSENTVRNHIFNLYKKLSIQRRLDLVLLVQKYQAPPA